MQAMLEDDLEIFDRADDYTLSAVGAHEVRAWTAAFAALRAAGPHERSIKGYHTVSEWLTGMGIMCAVPN